MLKGRKRSAIQEIGLQVPERAFDFAFRFGPPWPTGHGPEAVVGGKRQEARVVNRLVAVVTADDDFHIVIETLRGTPAQMREGGNVLANRRGEVLVFDKVHVLA